ncbi:MAG: SWIM zinc finger family protein [Chitinophagaceae bacterium]|nr:SWIM zinc finger family protein [Chitinophagaceae bacterium]
MDLTEEQILSLAPDASSQKAGLGLAAPAKWVTRSYNDVAIWGECQGSGSKPYQTQIDTTNIAFKCSCPSRKFPCKHGLGLLLLYARQKNNFTGAEAPAWVAEWLAKRSEKQEKQAEKKDKPVDESAQAKRQQQRQSKVEDGIAELKTWIKDIIRNGLTGIPDKEPTFFQNMSRRMIDAQAPGLAGMIRNLGDTNFYTEGWQSVFMDQLLRLYMVAESFKHIQHFSEPLQQDVRTWIGFTQNQEALKEQTGMVDTWLVLAKQISEDDNVTTERNWLYGTNSNSYALVLQFIVRGQGAQLTLMPGMFIQAELVFYPSVLPMRAIIKRQINSNAATEFTGFSNWQQVLQHETDYNSKLPFRSERPYIIQQVTPVLYNGSWWLQDMEKNMMPVRNEQRRIWKLLSISGGNAVDVVVVGREQSYEPVGLWDRQEYHLL